MITPKYKCALQCSHTMKSIKLLSVWLTGDSHRINSISFQILKMTCLQHNLNKKLIQRCRKADSSPLTSQKSCYISPILLLVCGCECVCMCVCGRMCACVRACLYVHMCVRTCIILKYIKELCIMLYQTLSTEIILTTSSLMNVHRLLSTKNYDPASTVREHCEYVQNTS